MHVFPLPAGWRAGTQILVAALLLSACHGDDDRKKRNAAAPPANDPAAPAYWPTTGWSTATPESQGFDNGAFDTLAADTAALMPQYTSLLVIKDGYLVFESYHSPDGGTTVIDADTKQSLWSVTKSVMSMTFGTAWTRGDLLAADLDARIEDVFPLQVGDLAADAGQRDITLRDTLQMRSGLRWNEAWDFTLESPLFYNDPACPDDDEVTVCTVLHRAQTYAPGTVWNYSTWDSYLAAGFFRQLTGTPLRDYAGTHLFAPLGIDYSAVDDWANWPTSSDYTFGGALLVLTSRDMARLGLLMLYDGQWDGARILSPEWLELSLTPIGYDDAALFDAGSTPVAGEPAGSAETWIPYSFQWWHSADVGDMPGDTLSAHGLFGQWIYIDPARELVIVLTNAINGTPSPFTEIQAFVDSEILAKLD
ncbi:MAG: serine hydrolase domain-containing protein [Pseudomonadota bacterium]